MPRSLHVPLILGMGLTVLGWVLSGYATWHHLLVVANGGTNAGCNLSAVVSCDAVAQSPYSEVVGIPVGVFGVTYFSTLFLVLALFARSSPNKTPEVARGYAALIVLGASIALSLAMLAVFKIKAVCLICLGVDLSILMQMPVAWQLLKRIKAAARDANHDQSVAFKGLHLTWRRSLMTSLVALGPLVTLPLAYSAVKPTLMAWVLDPGTMAETSTRHTELLMVDDGTVNPFNEDYRTNPAANGVVIDEFGDFSCPYCANLVAILDQLASEGRAQIVYRNFPLDHTCNSRLKTSLHESACITAFYARCAGLSGKFWEYHHLSFAEQASASAVQAKRWGMQVGLTDDDLTNCERNKASIWAKIKADIAKTKSLNLSTTPGLFVSGRRYRGPITVEGLRMFIDRLGHDLAQGDSR